MPRPKRAKKKTTATETVPKRPDSPREGEISRQIRLEDNPYLMAIENDLDNEATESVSSFGEGPSDFRPTRISTMVDFTNLQENVEEALKVPVPESVFSPMMMMKDMMGRFSSIRSEFALRLVSFEERFGKLSGDLYRLERGVTRLAGGTSTDHAIVQEGRFTCQFSWKPSNSTDPSQPIARDIQATGGESRPRKG
ncbi:hypothetical protein K440DRAFT_636196 [Wilcoxina mikolae CBS 423.85]|nr:hypothetical protein K440DRAFT_636196 [Wilcoxina mikolae CBS 423.85]